jgi:hypothetical protein
MLLTGQNPVTAAKIRPAPLERRYPQSVAAPEFIAPGLLTVAFDERPAAQMAQVQIVARSVTRAAHRSFDEAAAGEKLSQCAKPTDVSDAHSLFFLDRTAGV